MSCRARSALGVFAAVALTAGMLGVARGSIAEAATYPSMIKTSAPLDWCPGAASICQDSRRITTLAPGTRVRMECWIDAPSRSGTKLPRWFYVTVSSGATGWVKAERVGAQTSVSNCQNKPAVWASLWTTGLDHYGKTQPTTADRANMKKYYGFTNWGPKVDWSGDCKSFAALAWLSTSTSRLLPRGNAIDVYRAYKAQGKVRTSGVPPRGALVFWNVTSYGHVAVSLGNNRVVTTVGMDNDMRPITDMPLSGFRNYLGWVMPY